MSNTYTFPSMRGRAHYATLFSSENHWTTVAEKGPKEHTAAKFRGGLGGTDQGRSDILEKYPLKNKSDIS
jgi:hypothetical protein